MYEFISNGGMVIIVAGIIYVAFMVSNLVKFTKNGQGQFDLASILVILKKEVTFIVDKLVSIDKLDNTEEQTKVIVNDVYDELMKTVVANQNIGYYKQLKQVMDFLGKEMVVDFVAKYSAQALDKLRKQKLPNGGSSERPNLGGEGNKPNVSTK